jgi:hypothetical protein
MGLRDTSISLTGLELVRCLRSFVNARCDALGLQGHDTWHDVVLARKDDEEAFLARLGELRLRADLTSLLAAKSFAMDVVDGKDLFTRQKHQSGDSMPGETIAPLMRALKAWRNDIHHVDYEVCAEYDALIKNPIVSKLMESDV